MQLSRCGCGQHARSLSSASVLMGPKWIPDSQLPKGGICQHFRWPQDRKKNKEWGFTSILGGVSIFLMQTRKKSQSSQPKSYQKNFWRRRQCQIWVHTIKMLATNGYLIDQFLWSQRRARLVVLNQERNIILSFYFSSYTLLCYWNSRPWTCNYFFLLWNIYVLVFRIKAT